MKTLKRLLILALLALPVRADTISGSLPLSSGTVSYDLSVVITLNDPFAGLDNLLLNGMVTITDFSGATISTGFYGNDGFGFYDNSSTIFMSVGDSLGQYNFIGNNQGIAIDFTALSPQSFATPEPATIIYLATAASLFLIFFPRRRKQYRKTKGAL